MNMLAKKAKKGFTIVELVIVIAVIAILAAVLIPTFTGVINSANNSVAMQECRSEWSNYLPEIAAKTNDNSLYFVTFDSDYDSDDTSNSTYKADLYFLVKSGSFDTTAYSFEENKGVIDLSAETLFKDNGYDNSTYTYALTIVGATAQTTNENVYNIVTTQSSSYSSLKSETSGTYQYLNEKVIIWKFAATANTD